MIFQDFCFEKPPELVLGGSCNKLKGTRDNPICGIYAVVCLANERIYIGSSKNFLIRIKEGHIPDLRSGSHSNRVFQSYYKRYGEESMFWYLVERCNEEDLKSREQYYLDEYKPFPRTGRGFNLMEWVVDPHRWTQEEKDKRKGKTIALKNPIGEIVEFDCTIRKFAKDNNLRRENLERVIRGVDKYYLDWSLPGTPPKQVEIYSLEYIPTGENYGFTNACEFSREFDIKFPTIYSLINEVIKYTSDKKWKLSETVLPESFYDFIDRLSKGVSLISPNGEEVKCYDINLFSKEMNLKPTCLKYIIEGKGGHHRGWKLKNN